MNKIILAAVVSLFAVHAALAQAPAAAEKKATPQQEKMKACNADAKGKKGDERKAFMKECLSAKPSATSPGAAPAAAGGKAAPAAAGCEAKAAEKKLAGAAKSSFMKKCEADGKK
jgi:hypothetical protein